jgi:hypothetical protein
MDSLENTDSRRFSRQSIVEAVIAFILILLGFFAIAASDVSATGTRTYWIVLVVTYAIVAFVSDRMHTDHTVTDLHSAVTIGLHWLGVFLAIQLVHYFVSSGRMANADTGLTNGVVLALGTYLFGIYGNWRFLVIGLSLAAAIAGVAFVEEYIWVLFSIVVLAIVAIFIGARVVKRHSV